MPDGFIESDFILYLYNTPLLAFLVITLLYVCVYIMGAQSSLDTVEVHKYKAIEAIEHRRKELIDLVNLAQKIVNKDTLVLVDAYLERVKKENNLTLK